MGNNSLPGQMIRTCTFGHPTPFANRTGMWMRVPSTVSLPGAGAHGEASERSVFFCQVLCAGETYALSVILHRICLHYDQAFSMVVTRVLTPQLVYVHKRQRGKSEEREVKANQCATVNWAPSCPPSPVPADTSQGRMISPTRYTYLQRINRHYWNRARARQPFMKLLTCATSGTACTGNQYFGLGG